MKDVNLKKTFLYTLIGSIAVSALLGIWAILSGEFGEFQARVLMTTLTVVATSILGLACGAFWESQKSEASAIKVIPMAGIILTFMSALLTFSLIWEISSSSNELVYKTIAITGLFAFTFAQLSLLTLANLSKRFQWALTAIYLTALTLASIVSVLIVIEPESDGSLVTRLIGVLAVIDASLTVTIPIFHRLSRGEFSESSVAEIDLEIAELKSRIEGLERQKEAILNKEQKES